MIYSYQENSTMRCIKYIITIFCFLFMVTGVVMIILGTTINAVYRDYSYFLESQFFSPAAIVVAVGFITLGVSFLGCLGAIRESVCLIMSFVACLGGIFTLEIIAAISGYILMNQVRAYLKNIISATMYQYYINKEAADITNFLQSGLLCCGTNGPTDWMKIPNTEGLPSGIPDSCYTHNDMIYTVGCLDHLEFIIKQSGLILASSALLLACIQFSGMILAYNLGKKMREEKTAREYRRWMLREELLRNADTYFSVNPEKKGLEATLYTPTGILPEKE